MYHIEFQGLNDWRDKAREALKRNIVPDMLSWSQPQLEPSGLDLAAPFETLLDEAVQTPSPRLPKNFFQLAKDVAPYRNQNQWDHLYRLAFRLLFLDRRAQANALDPDRQALAKMQKHIHRDKHKMKAFVRFKRKAVPEEWLPKGSNSETFEYYVAWFEPQHHILADMADFFIGRFHNMHWSIFTPDASLHWIDKRQLYREQPYPRMHFDDPTETLWLEYYASIFNPARLKLKAMQSEMPKKYWPNLPEASLIRPLTEAAYARVENMVDTGGCEAWNKTQRSQQVQQSQQRLREKALVPAK